MGYNCLVCNVVYYLDIYGNEIYLRTYRRIIW